VVAELDSHGLKAREIKVLDLGGRRLEDDLKLGMFVESVGVVAVATVGGAATGLHISNPIRLSSKNPKESLGVHGSGANFQVIRLVNDATLSIPVARELEDDVLKGGG
jgi:hypothetical protein